MGDLLCCVMWSSPSPTLNIQYVIVEKFTIMIWHIFFNQPFQFLPLSLCIQSMNDCILAIFNMVLDSAVISTCM